MTPQQAADLVRKTVERARDRLDRLELRQKLIHMGVYGVLLALNALASDWGLGHGWGPSCSSSCWEWPRFPFFWVC